MTWGYKRGNLEKILIKVQNWFRIKTKVHICMIDTNIFDLAFNLLCINFKTKSNGSTENEHIRMGVDVLVLLLPTYIKTINQACSTLVVTYVLNFY